MRAGAIPIILLSVIAASCTRSHVPKGYHTLIKTPSGTLHVKVDELTNTTTIQQGHNFDWPPPHLRVEISRDKFGTTVFLDFACPISDTLPLHYASLTNDRDEWVHWDLGTVGSSVTNFEGDTIHLAQASEIITVDEMLKLDGILSGAKEVRLRLGDGYSQDFILDKETIEAASETITYYNSH